MSFGWKKLLAAALAGTLIAGSLSGCANGGKKEGGSSSEDTSVSANQEGGELTLDQIKAKGELVVATEAAYEPFEYLDKDGETIIGYNADLLQKICDDLGVKLVYKDLPFQGILAGLEAKKYDMVGATLGVTAERANKYTLTLPIQKGTNVFIKRKNDDSIQTEKDMNGKIVGTQTSAYNETDTIEYNKKLITEGQEGYSDLKTYDSFPEAYSELLSSQIDLVAQNYASAAALVKKSPDDFELVKDENGNVAMISETDTWLSWAVRKSDTELSDYIDSEIKKFKEDGTLGELQEKWFGAVVELPDTDYIPEK